jgi:nitrogen regulatory protein PII
VWIKKKNLNINNKTKSKVMELKTFKRLSDTKIALDGIIWINDAEKAVQIKNEETGGTLLSINVYGNYYYPYAIDTRKTK